jgi:hypothetical protein
MYPLGSAILHQKRRVEGKEPLTVEGLITGDIIERLRSKSGWKYQLAMRLRHGGWRADFRTCPLQQKSMSLGMSAIRIRAVSLCSM